MSRNTSSKSLKCFDGFETYTASCSSDQDVDVFQAEIEGHNFASDCNLSTEKGVLGRENVGQVV